jgi:hypothetical protein
MPKFHHIGAKSPGWICKYFFIIFYANIFCGTQTPVGVNAKDPFELRESGLNNSPQTIKYLVHGVNSTSKDADYGDFYCFPLYSLKAKLLHAHI